MLDERVGRQADGSYRDNALDAFYAVSCRDREMLADVPGSVERIAAQAPFLGEYLAWGNLPCLGSPVVPAAEAGARIPAILVVATTHDPATPFMWAEPFVDQLGSGAVLLVREGDGHTAYREGSACIDEAIDAYFIDGRLTETGTVCD
jgi:hypothetical protein